MKPTGPEFEGGDLSPDGAELAAPALAEEAPAGWGYRLLRPLGIQLDPAIMRAVLRIALPFMGAMVLRNLVGIIDYKMVGALIPVPAGASEAVRTAVQRDALAALAVSRNVMWILVSIFMGVGIASSTFVSQMFGAGRHKDLRYYATQSLMLAIYVALFFTALGLIFGSWFIGLLGLEPQVATYTWDYVSIMLIGLSLIAVNFVFISVFNGLGRTEYPFFGQIVINIANIFGNWYFIPLWGVAGSAIATVISTSLVVIMFSFKLWKDGLLELSRRIFQGTRRAFANLAFIALPSSAQTLTRSLSMFALFALIGHLPASMGDKSVGAAALGLGILTESLAFMPAFAFSVAAATLTGQHIGRRDFEGARRSVLHAGLLSFTIMTTMAAVFLIFPYPLVKFMASGNPLVIPEGVRYLRIAALSDPFIGISMALLGCLRGAGDVRAAFGIGLLALWGIRIPLAWILAVPVGMGLSGIWWAMTISAVIECGMYIWRYRSGVWTRISIERA